MRSLYMTDWGEVAISPDDAASLEHLAFICDAYRLTEDERLEPLVRRAFEKYRAKLDDIERVARWKHENA